MSKTETTKETTMNLTDTQRKVLQNLDHTAFYGQNQRTFGALERKGLIKFRQDGNHSPAGHYYILTEEGRKAL